MSVQGYWDLAAWQKPMHLVEAIYRAAHRLPRDEAYGLTNQALRAAVSVPANIAEGQGRRGPTEMLHHLSIADGSLHELENYLLIAQRLCYLDGATATIQLAQIAEIGRILGGLMRRMASQATGDRRQICCSMPFVPPVASRLLH
jgi:four helix bundle protein